MIRFWNDAQEGLKSAVTSRADPGRAGECRGMRVIGNAAGRDREWWRSRVEKMNQVFGDYARAHAESGHN